MTNLPSTAADVRLPSPDHIEWSRVMWTVAVVIGGMHVLALAAALPWLFSWTALIVCILGVHIFGQAITIGYHRLLSHRSFQTPKWFEHVIVIMALCCMEATPGRWIATHRYHHNHSDEHHDPHSPLVGFMWAHFGWLMVHNRSLNSIATYEKYARDILGDPFYMKLEKKPMLPLLVYLAHAAVFFLAGGVIGFLAQGTMLEALRMGLSLLVWGVIVRTVLVWHITWSVNSLTHLFGYRSHNTDDNSRNNWLVALLSVGEGWHNNHHHDPASASVQHKWWELDLSYYEIRLLEKLGLARKVTPPRHIRHAKRDAARLQATQHESA